MRIVAGAHRGAKLTTPESKEVRPTSDRVRESLFNVLDGGRFPSTYKNKLVIDAFAGTGALGLEAISRGASRVVFLEQAVTALKILFQHIRKLNAQEIATVITGDAIELAKYSTEAAGLVMLDPPYNSQIGAPCIRNLKDKGWIDTNTLIILEQNAKESITLPKWVETLYDRQYGVSRLIFMQVSFKKNGDSTL